MQLYQKVYQKRFLVQLKERYISRKPFYLSRHGKTRYARIIDYQTGKQINKYFTQVHLFFIHQ